MIKVAVRTKSGCYCRDQDGEEVGGEELGAEVGGADEGGVDDGGVEAGADDGGVEDGGEESGADAPVGAEDGGVDDGGDEAGAEDGGADDGADEPAAEVAPADDSGEEEEGDELCDEESVLDPVWPPPAPPALEDAVIEEPPLEREGDACWRGCRSEKGKGSGTRVLSCLHSGASAIRHSWSADMDMQTAADQQCCGLVDYLVIREVGNLPSILFFKQPSPHGVHPQYVCLKVAELLAEGQAIVATKIGGLDIAPGFRQNSKSLGNGILTAFAAIIC